MTRGEGGRGVGAGAPLCAPTRCGRSPPRPPHTTMASSSPPPPLPLLPRFPARAGRGAGPPPPAAAPAAAPGPPPPDRAGGPPPLAPLPPPAWTKADDALFVAGCQRYDAFAGATNTFLRLVRAYMDRHGRPFSLADCRAH